MIVLVFVDVAHEELHGSPALINDGAVSELFPHRPGDYNAGIRPAEAHHIAVKRTVLRPGGYTGIGACFCLGVAKVLKPFVEEFVCVGKEGPCLCKYLSISCPAKALVALRAVCGH